MIFNYNRSLLEASLDPSVIIGLDGKISDLNRAAETLSGLSRKDLIGKDCSGYFAEPEKARALYEKALCEGPVRNFELSFRQIPMLCNAAAYQDSSGQAAGVLAVAREIGKQKQMEAELSNSRERLQRTLHNMNAIVFQLNKYGILLIVEGSELKNLGFKPGLGVGTSIFSIYAADTEIIDSVKRALKGEAFSCEIKLDDRNFKIIYSPTFDTDGSQSGTVGIALDITERKLAEQERERLIAIINSSNDYISIADLEARVVYTNPAAYRMLGYDYFEGVGQLEIKDVNSPEESDFILKVAIPTAERQGTWSGEKHLRHRNGRLIEVYQSVFPVYSKEDDLIGYGTIIRDITKEKQDAEELRKYRIQLEELIRERTKELEKVNKLLQTEIEKSKRSEKIVKESLKKEKELNEMKTRFISTTSHEFRTPLTAVLSSADLLELYGRKWEPDKYKKHTSQIRRSVRYMTELLDDILTISRTDNGKIVFSPSLINLSNICTEIMENAKIKAGPKHRFIYEYGAKETEFNLDEKLIRQILTNLLSNAVKYSPMGGGIFFSLSDSGSKLVFRIEDEGIGIAPEDKENLTLPFYRAQNVANIPGTGLGLSIVKRSVEMHGGNLYFESQLGKGSVFTITIPI